MQKHSWQTQLAQAVTDPIELFNILKLDLTVEGLHPVTQKFALRVPHSFIARMELGNPKDPLLLQVLPQPQELSRLPGYTTDPLGELPALKIPGLLHKYQNRLLLLLAGGCAVNCRYCFRRNFPYQDNIVSIKQIEAIINYISQEPAVEEVILSGGDPLLVKDELLQILIQRLNTISHLKYLRFHTRLPIVLPARITSDFIQVLKYSRLQTTLIVHANHPQEIDKSVAVAIEKLRAENFNVFNQSVLLKNINDDASTLIALSHKLYGAGIIPYYLHLLDAVHGAGHFDTPIATAKSIMQTLRRELPGYLVPKLVREIQGEPNKIPIF